jgi:LysM repeat protein
MKILKILGIAAGVHALALILIFANPGCSYTKAAGPDSLPISSAPSSDGSTQAPSAAITVPDSVGIRYSPTRPGTTVASALATQPVADVTPATTYTVSKGDSLYSIAKKNGILKADLATANHLKTTAALHVGQKLVIPAKSGQLAAENPPAETAAAQAKAPDQGAAEKAPLTDATKHTVRPGETLGAIARKYGVKQGDIAVANNITDPRKIQPGQELVIPAHTASGKQSKGAKADSAAGAKTAPAADQDLDAGLKPPSAAEVPVVKIEDPSSTPAPRNP